MNLELHLSATLPVLAPLLAALVVLLLDVALPHRREPHLVVAAVGLAARLWQSATLAAPARTALMKLQEFTSEIEGDTPIELRDTAKFTGKKEIR